MELLVIAINIAVVVGRLLASVVRFVSRPSLFDRMRFQIQFIALLLQLKRRTISTNTHHHQTFVSSHHYPFDAAIISIYHR